MQGRCRLPQPCPLARKCGQFRHSLAVPTTTLCDIAVSFVRHRPSVLRRLKSSPMMATNHLKDHYRGRGGFVGVDLSMRYVKGSPGEVLAPDLFVAHKAEKRPGRPSYKLWEEPTPDFVLEDLSPSNWRRDAVDKRELYQQLGVQEYWMFDETGRRLRDDSEVRIGERLVGYRLCTGKYKRVPANDAGRLPSEALGLKLCVRDELVRFHDPETKRYLPTLAEERAAREAAEQRAAAALARLEALEAELRT